MFTYLKYNYEWGTYTVCFDLVRLESSPSHIMEGNTRTSIFKLPLTYNIASLESQYFPTAGTKHCLQIFSVFYQSNIVYVYNKTSICSIYKMCLFRQFLENHQQIQEINSHFPRHSIHMVYFPNHLYSSPRQEILQYSCHFHG